MEYPAEYYDAIHSRDAILHMHDKSTLFKNMYKSLKPGGKLLITDYCRNDDKTVEDKKFEEYVKNYNYDLITIAKYKSFLTEAGFSNVDGIDNSRMFSDILKEELETLSCKDVEDKIKEIIGSKEYQAWYDLWKDKIHRVEKGEHVWGLFTAEKPLL